MKFCRFTEAQKNFCFFCTISVYKKRWTRCLSISSKVKANDSWAAILAWTDRLCSSSHRWWYKTPVAAKCPRQSFQPQAQSSAQMQHSVVSSRIFSYTLLLLSHNLISFSNLIIKILMDGMSVHPTITHKKEHGIRRVHRVPPIIFCGWHFYKAQPCVLASSRICLLYL